MTEFELREFARDCFAALGANMPGINSPAWRIWAEMCAAVPLEASVWIRGRIIQLDSMPRNFGKTVKTLHADWRSEAGKPAQKPQCCPNCDWQTPGFFTVWREDGNRVLCRCRCNSDPQCDPMPYRMPGDMAELGFIVRPAGYAGALTTFEREHFPVSGQGDSKTGYAARRLARNPVGKAEPRKAHREYMDHAECPF